MINYQNLAKSIDFYEESGFKRIEAPWLVPPCIDSITKPKDKRHYMLGFDGRSAVYYVTRLRADVPDVEYTQRTYASGHYKRKRRKYAGSVIPAQ